MGVRGRSVQFWTPLAKACGASIELTRASHSENIAIIDYHKLLYEMTLSGPLCAMQSEEPCEPCELDLDTEWRELDALTVVDTIRPDQVAEKASSSHNLQG